jgi:hypothetical protein
MKDLSFQFDSDPCPQNDPNQGDLMAAIAAAADPPVAFRNFNHLVLVEPNTGCCLRSPSDIGICGGGYKKSRKRHTPIPMALSRIDADDFSISTVVVAHELGPNFWLGHAHLIDCGSNTITVNYPSQYWDYSCCNGSLPLIEKISSLTCCRLVSRY